MTINGKAYIAGAYEHPRRKAVDKSLAQLHAEVAKGALDDAGLTTDDVDGYFCAGDAPGLGGMSMADYMGLKLRHMDNTETGGSSYVVHVGHAAEAVAASWLLPGRSCHCHWHRHSVPAHPSPVRSRPEARILTIRAYRRSFRR